MNASHDLKTFATTHQPGGRNAPIAEVSVALAKDHEELAKSLQRLRDFVKGCDAPLAHDEWVALEPAVLRHLEAEEEFLLPAFEVDDPCEAKAILDEHQQIRSMLDALGLALELHVLRDEQFDRLNQFLTKHVTRETASLYVWAGAYRNRLLSRSMLRQIGAPAARATDESLVSVLLDLVETCDDGEQGYRQAAGDTADSGDRLIFERHAKERAVFASALRKRLEQLGCHRETPGTVLGAIHRDWLEVSGTLMGDRPCAILRECLRGDGAALRVYGGALRAGLPPDLQELVQTQHTALQTARDEMQALLGMQGGKAGG
jgi:uncharacterized protein (TIGR02284 family)